MLKSKSDSMKHVFIETCLIVTKRWALGRARSKLRKETLEQKKHWWTKMWEMMWVAWKDIGMGEKANMVEGKKNSVELPYSTTECEWAKFKCPWLYLKIFCALFRKHGKNLRFKKLFLVWEGQREIMANIFYLQNKMGEINPNIFISTISVNESICQLTVW